MISAMTTANRLRLDAAHVDAAPRSSMGEADVVPRGTLRRPATAADGHVIAGSRVARSDVRADGAAPSAGRSSLGRIDTPTERSVRCGLTPQTPRLSTEELALVAVGPGRPIADIDHLTIASGQAVTTLPYQSTKVQRPPLPDQTLHRERLLGWLDANVRHPIVFVVAEAGYGKTTLVSDYALRTRNRTLWYRLDEDDRDWVTFLTYLVAAGREVVPDFASGTADLLLEAAQGPVDRQRAIAAFVAELPAIVEGPTALVFDDYHLVDDGPDVREIVDQLVDHLPPELSLVFVSRRQPPLPVARLRSQGGVVDLSGSDLRFDADETARLFRDAYRQPLEPDVLVELQARTEGWVACLHLVRAVVRGRTQAEIRAFVGGLSGAQEALHDYLAEEVVGDLDEPMQQFLMRTSILQVVDPELTTVVTGEPPARARSLITASEGLGLLTRRGALTRFSQRYHPLVRDFLEARLRRQVGDEQVAELHRAVARFGEPRSWRLAAYHYSAAGDVADVHRVIATSTAAIVGSGEFRAAEPYIDRHPPQHPNPWFDIILSRVEHADGREGQALQRARAAYSAFGAESADPSDEGANLAIANLMGLELSNGTLSAAARLAEDLNSRRPDASLAVISRAAVDILRAVTDGDLDRARESLLEAESVQQGLGHRHYQGISLLNMAWIDRARGDPNAALDESTRSIALLTESSGGGDVATARTARAWALAHLGRWIEAGQEMGRALAETSGGAHGEAVVECADIHGFYGDPQEAIALLEAETTLEADRAWPYRQLVLASNLMRLGDLERSAEVLAQIRLPSQHPEVAMPLRVAVAKLHHAVLSGSPNVSEIAHEAGGAARSQRARHWERLCSLLTALGGATQDVRQAVSLAGSRDLAYLDLVADVLALKLAELDAESLATVGNHVRQRPWRWRFALREAMERGCEESQLRAARFLDEVGTEADVAPLRALSRRLRGSTQDPNLGKALARRVAPRVYVEDLGRVGVFVGSRWIPGNEIRRKVLAMLCFLLSRPAMSATRDQVLDALWPDQEPDVAVNSLNQTAYFLRRVIEPRFQEDLTPGYLHHENQMVWLDSDLVTSRSIECRAMLRAVKGDPSPEQMRALSQGYRGRFALDFAYEEWAAASRDSLHASYLGVVERSIRLDTANGEFDRAILLAQKALDADPEADRIEAALLGLYRRVGAHSAAAEQYGHYAATLRNDLGIEPPPLDAL